MWIWKCILYKNIYLWEVLQFTGLFGSSGWQILPGPCNAEDLEKQINYIRGISAPVKTRTGTRNRKLDYRASYRRILSGLRIPQSTNTCTNVFGFFKAELGTSESLRMAILCITKYLYILLGPPGYTQAFPYLRPGPLNCLVVHKTNKPLASRNQHKTNWVSHTASENDRCK